MIFAVQLGRRVLAMGDEVEKLRGDSSAMTNH
jgi:hypothetical protein